MELLQHGLNRKGRWTTQEDDQLRYYVNTHGIGHWDTLAHKLDIGRSGNSCRLRWVNYLSPFIVRGNITDQEMLFIIKLHSQLGNQWSKIAQHLPGRTDNEMKNFWNTRVKKEAKLLNCDVESNKFLQIMTDRINAASSSMLIPPLQAVGGAKSAYGHPHTATISNLASVAAGDQSGGGAATTLVATSTVVSQPNVNCCVDLQEELSDYAAEFLSELENLNWFNFE